MVDRSAPVRVLLLVLALALPPQLMGGCDRDVQPLQLTDVLRASGGAPPPRKAGKPLPPCSRADLNSTKTVMALDSTGTDGFGSEVCRALHLTYVAAAMGLPSPVCPAPSFHLQRSTVLIDAPGGRAGIHYCHAFRSADHKVQGAKAVRRAFSADPDWWSGMRCYRFDIPGWMRSWCLCTATAGGDAVAHAASATCVIGASNAVGKGRVGAPAGLFEDPRARPRMLETTRLLRRNYRRAQLGNVSSGGTLGKTVVVVAVHIRNGDAERRGTLGGAPIETTTALLQELLDLLTGAGYEARLHLHSETSSRRPDSGGLFDEFGPSIVFEETGRETGCNDGTFVASWSGRTGARVTARASLNVHPLATLNALVAADVLVLATSSLSNTAALLSDGVKLYNPKTQNSKPSGPLHSTILHMAIKATSPSEWLPVTLPVSVPQLAPVALQSSSDKRARFEGRDLLDKLARVRARRSEPEGGA